VNACFRNPHIFTPEMTWGTREADGDQKKAREVGLSLRVVLTAGSQMLKKAPNSSNTPSLENWTWAETDANSNRSHTLSGYKESRLRRLSMKPDIPQSPRSLIQTGATAKPRPRACRPTTVRKRSPPRCSE
jgi:hypothetical protein